ncbi:MAG: hypothetical protein IJ009_02000 [Clostridia bacterium]|nr:hypothetical protein [Clostridia bacterium]
MKKTLYLFCIVCLLCGLLTACTQTPTSTQMTTDFVTIPNNSNPAKWYNHSHIPPQALQFASADDMISFICNRDLSQAEELKEIGLAEETAYSHAIYSLWGVGYIPILGTYRNNECMLFPMSRYDSIGIITSVEKGNERFRIGFYLKTPYLVDTLNNDYDPQNYITLNNDGQEINAIFYRSSDRYRLIFGGGSSYFVTEVECFTDERITAQELYERYCGLEVNVEYIDLWDLRGNPN